MKKILATVLATAMALSLSTAAFAGIVKPSVTPSAVATAPGHSNNDVIYPKPVNTNKDKVVVVPYDYKGDIDIATFTSFPIFTYGNTDNIEFSIVPALFRGSDPYDDAIITSITAHVNSDNVTVSVKRNDGTINSNKKAPTMKIKASNGGKDFKFDEEMNDISIDVDMTIGQITTAGATDAKRDTTVTLKADKQVAYSKTQELLNDEDITLGKAAGTIVKFSDAISDKTRVRASEYVDVFFKGNYGTDKENMRVFTDSIDAVDVFFEDTDTNVYDFQFTPKFASSVKVAIDCDPAAVVYEYNKKTGDMTKIETGYESNAATFETKALGCYVVSEDEYEDGNVKGDGEVTDEEPAEDEEPTIDDPTTGKQNPETGANDMVGAAAAMAVVSLLAAGAVAFKKASK